MQVRECVNVGSHSNEFESEEESVMESERVSVKREKRGVLNSLQIFWWDSAGKKVLLNFNFFGEEFMEPRCQKITDP